MEKKFLREVWGRLCTFQFKLLPIRKRPEDLELLIHFYINEMAALTHTDILGISTEAFDLLMNYHWPKNLRDVKACLVSSLFRMEASNKVIERHHIEPYFIKEEHNLTLKAVFEEAFAHWPLDFLKNAKDYYLIENVKKSAKSKKELADSLGLGRTALFNKERKLKQFHKQFDQHLTELDKQLRAKGIDPDRPLEA